MQQPETLFSPHDHSNLDANNLRAQLKLRDQENEFLRSQISQLQEMLIELKRMKFGKRSERWESEEQILLFNEVEQEGKKAEGSDRGTKTEVKGHTRERGKRKPLPSHLDREIVKIELPLEEQFTEDGTPLKVIGYEISEKLEYEPSKTRVIEYHRAKYGVDSGDYVKTAPPVPSVIPKGIATPSLLAGIAVRKFADGLPLYRQEEIFSRNDIDLSRSSMARWMIKAAEALQPIWNVLSDRLTESFYVSVDETRTQVLKEKGRRAESQSWMWVRSTPYGPNKIVLFDYSPSRSGDVAVEILDGFKGYLQVDGYGGYNEVSKKEGVIRLGCNMHGRRGFEKAQNAGAKPGKTLAQQGLEFYRQLYETEEEVRSRSPEERYKERLERAAPIWSEFRSWANQHQSQVPPQSKIGKAFSYFQSEYEYLTGYLKDGRLEADSGFVERCIRKFAIGRNNWMFSDTIAGAEASALLYSFVVTAKINKVNPYRALKYIFEQVPRTQTLEGYEGLADIIIGARTIPQQ